MTEQVTNNADEHRYEFVVDGEPAIAAYEKRGDTIVFTHTEVPAKLEGRGIGSRLIQGALDDVRARGERIVAQPPEDGVGVPNVGTRAFDGVLL